MTPPLWGLGLIQDREGVESFVVDPTQPRLFCLHTRGEIEMFDVSTGRFDTRGRYSRLRGDLAARGLFSSSAPAQADIVAIAPIGNHESRRICLVAILRNGEWTGLDPAGSLYTRHAGVLHRHPFPAVFIPASPFAERCLQLSVLLLFCHVARYLGPTPKQHKCPTHRCSSELRPTSCCPRKFRQFRTANTAGMGCR